MINLVMTGADGVGGVWQDPVQLIPMGMYDDPVGFVTRIRDALPLVNTLRVLFNEHSFNADGSLHPQMEAFLVAAEAQGFNLTICYGEGDAQNIGIGSGRWPALTNAEAFAALEENLADVSGAWEAMLDWMAAHPEVARGVWGWELMNESAAYRNTVRANGAGDGLTVTDFVQLYADHALQLAQMIDARAAGRILVGGWGYNGDFLTLEQTQIQGASALDYLRAGVGADLVWSAHLYPGWMGTDFATTPADLIARLEAVYAPVAEDAVMITEINADGQVDDPAAGAGYDDFFAASYEWFADRGIGFGWYPGLQTGASHLLYLEGNGAETYRHQHSLAHALNAFSLGRAALEADLAESLEVSQITVRLRNESYEIAAGEGDFDAVTKAGFAFGYGADDTLHGSDQSNDFLYGGRADDRLDGLAADDFLFGQQNNDRLTGGAGADNLFGGWGMDTLDGGEGRDYLAGGQGNDTYLVSDALDTIAEHTGFGSDLVQTMLAAYGLGANLEHLSCVGSADFAGTGNALANWLTGGGGADTLAGLDGRDTLEGGSGGDVLLGGAGVDLASYARAAGGVQVDLSRVLAILTAGEAMGDSFVSVENLTGSAFGDRLTGGAGANTIRGLAGQDRLAGRAGADLLFGGAGADRFLFARGDASDRIGDFQDDLDRIVLSGFAGQATVAEALALAQQDGAHVVFDFGAGDRLTVLNCTVAALADDVVIL